MTNFSYQLKLGIDSQFIYFWNFCILCHCVLAQWLAAFGSHSQQLYLFFIDLFTLVKDGTPIVITNKKQPKYVASYD